MSDISPQEARTEPSEVKLPLLPLIAFGVGSMVGTGIFGLPKQMAGVAAPGALIIGWIVTGIGMLSLAFVFQSLNATRPDVNGGVYGYSREALGNYGGYASAWSYWLSAWAGNLSYVTFFVTALGSFGALSFLTDGDQLTWSGLLLAIAFIWGIHFLILAGVRTAAFVNTIITIAKVVPLIVFIICAAIAFKVGFFTADFWGNVVQIPTDDGPVGLGSTLNQVSKMMLITVWVFIGIEGAAVYSTRAKKKSDVGKATMIAFLTVLALLIFVNLLSYGLMSQPQLAQLADPSLSGVMEAAVGWWGSAFINIAILISVAGAMLTWVMLAAEILYVPAHDLNIAKAFSRANKKESPTVSLWFTNIVSTIVLIILITAFSADYTDLIILAASLILPCYVISAVFQIKQTITGTNAVKGAGGSYAWRLGIGIVALVYTIWLTWAGGIGLLFLNGLMWLIGTPLYMRGRSEKGKKAFAQADLIVFIVVVILAILLFAWIAWFDGSVIDSLFWNGLS